MKERCLMEPINKLIIRDDKTSDGYSEIIAKIDDHGNLVLEGVDGGKDVDKFFGDSDYEYWLTVPKDFKDTALLYLIKERFPSVHDLKSWLEEKQIPCNYTSY